MSQTVMQPGFLFGGTKVFEPYLMAFFCLWWTLSNLFLFMFFICESVVFRGENYWRKVDNFFRNVSKIFKEVLKNFRNLLTKKKEIFDYWRVSLPLGTLLL
jgi:hypothetical protein